jgi:hypothetical protein
MLARHGEVYAGYLRRTGMFVPRWLESKGLPVGRALPGGALGRLLGSVATIALLLGGGFVLRGITLQSLPIESGSGVTLVSILPEDAGLQVATLRGVESYMAGHDGAILSPDKDYLGYVMPGDYIMQGMIADTGGHSQLHKQHHTRTLIVDWVLHPFAHLRRPPSAAMARMHGVDPAMARRHHCPMGIDDPSLECASCPYRRVILLEVSAGRGRRAVGRDCLSIGTRRRPVCWMDIDTRTSQIVGIHPVDDGTAWRDVPTPVL